MNRVFVRTSPVVRLFLYIPLLVSGGCGGSRRNVISAIPRDTSAAYYVAEHAGLSEAAAQHHVSIYWNGPTGENSSEQQIVLVQRAINRGEMGLILTPTAPFALDTVIQRALAKGMPVVILGQPISLPQDPKLSFVLTDVDRSGQLAAQRVQQIVPPNGKIAIVGIDPMTPGSKELAAAFESSLTHLAPTVRIVDRLVGPLTFGQAEMALEKCIEDHPDLNAIYSLTVPGTRGAVAARRTSNTEKKIKILGNDQTLDLLVLLRQGVLDSLVIQDMRGMGFKAVKNIVTVRKGDQVERVSYFQPVLLTRENIDTEPVQQMLKMDWRPRE